MMMKRIVQLLGTVGFALAMLLAKKAHGADAGSTARFVDSITVAPVVALRGTEITGGNLLGAGLDLGFEVNPSVSIHVGNLTYENNDWRTPAVDETEVYGKANFAKFANESFFIYGKGGATRNWNTDAWALGVGLGAQLNLSKSVSLGADYTVNAWFSGPEDKSSLARGLLNLSF